MCCVSRSHWDRGPRLFLKGARFHVAQTMLRKQTFAQHVWLYKTGMLPMLFKLRNGFSREFEAAIYAVIFAAGFARNPNQKQPRI